MRAPTHALLLGALLLVACGADERSGRRTGVPEICPPLRVPSAITNERVRAEAVVGSAERFLRGAEPQGCPGLVGRMYVETTFAMLTVGMRTDRGTHDVELTAQLTCDWRASACGSRPSDWSIDGDNDAWLAARRVYRGAAWLMAHPEIVLVSEQSLGRGEWTRRRVLRVNDTVICVANDFAMEHAVCWADPRPAAHLWAWRFEWPRLSHPTPDDEYDYDRVRGFIGLGPFGGRMDVWAVRFPEAEWVSLPSRPALDTRFEQRPLWFPSSRGRRPPADRLPRAGWRPIVRVEEPNLGELSGLSTVVVGASSGEDLSAMDLVTDAALAVCVRREGRWACAPTVAIDPLVFHEDSHEDAYTVASRTGRTWIVLQRATWEDGGNGDGSGAGGDQFLELYRDDGARLTPVASIRLGHMNWETVRLRRGFWRSVERYSHAHHPAGTDCLRIDPPIVHAGWADGSFVTAHVAGRARRPSRLEPAPAVVPFAPFPTVHDVSAEELPQDHSFGRDFAGVWRIEPNRLMRISRDPHARCD